MSTSGPSTTGGTAGPNGDHGTGGELPWAFIDCPTDTLILLISHMLNLLIQHNDQVVLTPDALTRFHSRAAPGISVLEYLRRIVKYTNMEKIPLLSLLAYIDITCQHLPTFTLSSLTVHRFLIAGVCAGSKAQCDVFCTNAHYAKVGGIKVQELNALEREFLKVTQWNLCCNADLLQRYYTSLIRSHGGYTQASEPTVRPFLSFPRSMSKPREETEEDMEGGADDGSGEEDEEASEGEVDENEEIEEYEGEGEGHAVPGPSRIRHTNGAAHEPGSSTSSTSPRKASLRKSKSGDLDRGSKSTDADGMDVDGDSAVPSPSTSSIPSSSRSSLRGRSATARGRTMSLSYSDARIAQPQLDRSTASGSPFTKQRDSSSTSPLSQFASSRDPGPSSGDQVSEPSRSVQNLQQAQQAHSGVGAQGSHTSSGREAGHDHQHNYHLNLHNPGAHLLKAIGGMFHHKKHNHPDKTADLASSVSATTSASGASSTNGQAILDTSRHLERSPRQSSAYSATTSVQASKPGAQQSSKERPLNGLPTPAQPQFAPPDRGRSPRTLISPGQAKPVTPRVRLRDELSESEITDLQGMPVLGDAISGTVEGNRRARVE